jgi:FkbM family methyltransferase
MFRNKVKQEASSTEMALARMDTRLEQISSLYEPLVVRVAKLEALSQQTGPAHRQHQSTSTRETTGRRVEESSVMQRKAGWLRILRHMLPHKIRQLLSEHDEFERMQGAVLQRGYAPVELRQAELRKRIRAHGEFIAATDVPAFPAMIFRADATNQITIIDVGAQDLTSEGHIYAPLQAAGATKIIGFEPLPDMDASPRRADPSVEMLEHFVGSGEGATFHVTQFDPASSLFEPNQEFLSQFVDLSSMCRTVSSFAVKTTRLDDVPEITACDYLKIDVQGGELDVLAGAQRLLKTTIIVHCEVEFGPVYKGQPLFADIDGFLRSNGFELIDLVNAGYNRYKALPGTAQTGSRLLWAEAIYFKTPVEITQQNKTNILKAAYIAHVNYCMFDLAAHYLAAYDRLEGSSLLRSYLADLSSFSGWQGQGGRV